MPLYPLLSLIHNHPSLTSTYLAFHWPHRIIKYDLPAIYRLLYDFLAPIHRLDRLRKRPNKQLKKLRQSREHSVTLNVSFH